MNNFNNNPFGGNNSNVFNNNNTFNTTQNNSTLFSSNIPQQQNNSTLFPNITQIFNNPQVDQNNPTIIQLNKIYSSYLPNSSEYKFKHWFYNLSATKIVRPSNISQEKWDELYINDNLMPVELNKEQIAERVIKQNDLICKLNNSKYSINDSIEVLMNQRNVISSKLKNCIYKFRTVGKNVLMKNENLFISNHASNIDQLTHNKLYVTDKEMAINVMQGIKMRIKNKIKKIKNEIRELEQGHINKTMKE